MKRASFLWHLAGCAEDGVGIGDELLNDLLTSAKGSPGDIAAMKGVVRAGGMTLKQVTRSVGFRKQVCVFKSLCVYLSDVTHQLSN